MSLTIEVRLGARTYPVRVGHGILAEVGGQTKHTSRGQRALIVTNAVVDALYGRFAAASLEEAGYDVSIALVEDSETAKSLASAQKLYDRLVESGHERTDPVVALGGGVVGDLAGFVAGTYMRGVPFVQIPTTLLAQVDSSVGGKVAVNLAAGKNLVGVFWQPRLVIADVATLESLPDRQVVAGAAEIVKMALLGGGEYLAFISEQLEAVLQRQSDTLVRAIAGCVAAKARVVEADETEHGMREILNLGHTTAHALEQQSTYGTMLHGEAVAVGLLAAAYVAEQTGVCGVEEAERARELVRRLGVEVPRAIDIDGLVGQMYRDKKARCAALRFVLLRRAGEPTVETVAEAPLRAALTRMMDEEPSKPQEE